MRFYIYILNDNSAGMPHAWHTQYTLLKTGAIDFPELKAIWIIHPKTTQYENESDI